MTQTLGLQGEETVLEIGTGSGYQAAVLAHLAREVHTIERHKELAENARNALIKLELTNSTVHLGDGTLGLPEFAPFDAILVTAAAPKIPQPLLAQLADGGRLVLPVGGRIGQYLECWQRRGGEYDRNVLVPVAFVPLRGQHGWGESEWDHF
jgi:protein-L-isoaspartate(D-aspartate) O-methyltransferase